MAQTKKTTGKTTGTKAKTKSKKTIEIQEEQILHMEEIETKDVPENAEIYDEGVIETSEENDSEILTEPDIIEGKVDELLNEYSNPQEKIEEIINNNPDNIKEALKSELNRVSNLEESVKEEIKKTEVSIKKNRKDSSFINFWCGVSDGWNN